jgi:heat shock transcription factor, other eukaryote
MASQGLSRKRPAPGTSPVPHQICYPPAPGMSNYGGLDPQVSNDQFLQYGYQPQIDNTQISYNDGPIHQQSIYRSEVGEGSNQLARRPANQVVSRDRARGDSSEVRWDGQMNANAHQLDRAWGDDIDDLKQRAQIAKKEAQSKRKQIPPFVQKLAR